MQQEEKRIHHFKKLKFGNNSLIIKIMNLVFLILKRGGIVPTYDFCLKYILILPFSNSGGR